MTQFAVNVLVPLTIIVEAETEDDARDQILTERKYAPLDNDGNRIQILDDDITSIETV